MSLDQQIKYCEEKINRLENLKKESGKGAMIDPAQIEMNLNLDYQQFALLKIRRMMGF